MEPAGDIPMEVRSTSTQDQNPGPQRPTSTSDSGDIGPPRTRSQRLRTIIRQNSSMLGEFAETVTLPLNRRSIKKKDQQLLQSQMPTPEQNEIDLESQAKDSGPKIEEKKRKFPIFILVITIVECLIFVFGDLDAQLIFWYDPYRRHEVWRYATVMLVHSSVSHLTSNMIFQVILGTLLEIVHHWKRIGIIYVSGVVGGTLAITILDPKMYCVGASAGVYALLISHLITIILNWDQMDKKCCRLFWLLLYISLDVGVNMYNQIVLKVDSKVSHAGHLGGAVAGFLVSAIVLKNFEKLEWEKRFQKICIGIIIGLMTIIIIVNVSFPSYYFETEFNTDYILTYVKHLLKLFEEDEEFRKANQKIYDELMTEYEKYKANMSYVS